MNSVSLLNIGLHINKKIALVLSPIFYSSKTIAMPTSLILQWKERWARTTDRPRGVTMIHKSLTVRLSAMSTGISVIFAVLLLLPVSSTFAAGDARPMVHPMPSRVTPKAALPDPRIAEFNRQLAAYKQTVAALRLNTKRLVAQQQRLDTLVNDLGGDAELNMIKLQSLMSQRQAAIQLTSNLLKTLNDSEKNIVQNIK
jgi:hypothetical protein